MFEIISKLSFNRSLNIILIVFGCLIGPFWFIYQFYSELYQSIELSKLLILALSAGIPTCLAMTIINSIAFGKVKEKDDEKNLEIRFLLMGLSSGFCGFIFYLPICLTYFLEGISAREAISLMLYVYGGAISYTIFRFIKGSLKKNRTRKIEKAKADQ